MKPQAAEAGALLSGLNPDAELRVMLSDGTESCGIDRIDMINGVVYFVLAKNDHKPVPQRKKGE